MNKTWKVSEVARAAHVTVRTLHHYDEIGLLVPSERSGSGYRLYTDADLQRLHQILLMRELGFQLEAIPPLLDAPADERAAALRAQRSLLQNEMRKTEAVIRAVDAAIDALERGSEMEKDKLFEGFENFDHTKYEAEARERWGDTDALRQDGQMPSPIVLRVQFVETGPAIQPMRNAVKIDDRTYDVTWPVDVWFSGKRTHDVVLTFGPRKIDKITLDPRGRFPDRDVADNVWPR